MNGQSTNGRPFFRLAIIAAAFALAFLATVAISAATLGSSARFSRPIGPSLLQDSSASRGFTVDIVSTTGFETTLGFSIELADPLADGESPALDLNDLVVKTAAGHAVPHDTWVQHVTYGVSSDRRKASFVLQGKPFETTNSLSLDLAAYYVVPPGGDGVRHAGDWSAVVEVDPRNAPAAGDAGTELVGRRIDTGFGWSYVIDRVQSDGIGIRLDYHVEGDVEGLTAIPPDTAEGEVRAMLSTTHPGYSLGSPEPGTKTVRVRFGGAVRAIHSPSTVVFAAADDSPSTIDLDGRRHAAVLEISNAGGQQFVSVRIESDLMFAGPGSPGQDARLTDDLGNVYPLYHGSASNPPKFSQWDFEGPIDHDATTLTLSIDGYGVVEQGDWVLDVPVE